MDIYGFPTITNCAFRSGALTPQQIHRMREEYNENGREAVYEYARERKILPFVAAVCQSIGCDASFWAGISARYRQRNQNVINQLDKVFHRFGELHVRKAFLSENFGALLMSGADVSLFASGDVDIYADISEKERIYEAFHSINYSCKELYTGKKLNTSIFYNDNDLDEGFGIDINWEPLSRKKLPCMICADKFVDWSALSQYDGTSIELPSREALLYICLLHISLHSFSRAPDIRLYVDIMNCAKAHPDWSRVLHFAINDSTLVRVLTAAYLANRLLDLELPPCVLEAMKCNDREIQRVLQLVYSKKKNQLIYWPSRSTVFRIEACSDDTGCGVVGILFPGKEWLKAVYMSEGDGYFCAEMKHLSGLFS